MPDLAPIVLFVYNRPEHTRRTLQALAANPLAKDSDLVVYADGAKKSEHKTLVEDARRVARSAVGFKSVSLVERDRNFGLANSIMEGVSALCASHGRAIVVEDDLIVAPGFLRFLNAGLDRYKDVADVFQVSAYAYPAHDGTTPNSFFLPMISCWGWATWARAWEKFDPKMAALERLDRDAVERRRFNIYNTYDYYGMACQQRDGKLDSWGIRWQLSLFAESGLVLYPRDSLVYNAGVDASGTHGLGGQMAFQRELKAEVGDELDIKWPVKTVIDGVAMQQVKQLLRANRPGLIRRIIERVRA